MSKPNTHPDTRMGTPWALARDEFQVRWFGPTGGGAAYRFAPGNPTALVALLDTLVSLPFHPYDDAADLAAYILGGPPCFEWADVVAHAEHERAGHEPCFGPSTGDADNCPGWGISHSDKYGYQFEQCGDCGAGAGVVDDDIAIILGRRADVKGERIPWVGGSPGEYEYDTTVDEAMAGALESYS